MFLITTDAGSDQSSHRRALKTLAADYDNILVFDLNCVLHQGHLITKEGYDRIDKHMSTGLTPKQPEPVGSCTKFWASLAKLCHIWRDNGTRITELWQELFGPSSIARALPLQCIAGRWLSGHNTEEFLKKRGMGPTTRVLNLVLANKVTAKKRGTAKKRVAAQTAAGTSDVVAAAPSAVVQPGGVEMVANSADADDDDISGTNAHRHDAVSCCVLFCLI